MFQNCEICQSNSWEVKYTGPIRTFGKEFNPGNGAEKANVAKCKVCGVSRLDESDCIKPSDYETEAYRVRLNQGTTDKDFYAIADDTQIFNMSAFWPLHTRGKVIADIGCGAGSFLDHIVGAKRILAVEPSKIYHESLTQRGYDTYSYVSEVLKDQGEAILDYAFCFQVIEHVLDPVNFLKEIGLLLKPGGVLIIATPNLDDILMKLLPDIFPSFYYRTVHRWYFNKESLRYCCEKAGFEIKAERHIHTYGIANMLNWYKEHRATGNAILSGIDALADSFWQNYLESTGQADNVYIKISKK